MLRFLMIVATASVFETGRAYNIRESQKPGILDGISSLAHKAEASVSGLAHEAESAVSGLAHKAEASVSGLAHEAEAAVSGLAHEAEAAVSEVVEKGEDEAWCLANPTECKEQKAAQEGAAIAAKEFAQVKKAKDLAQARGRERGVF